MTTEKASYGSKSFAYDASLLLPVSRPSAPAQADASSVAPFMLHTTSSSLQSKSAAVGKSSSIIRDHSSGRMENAVMQSCWIQRLNPACQTEVEEPTEPRHVWTHFTKDFSSCSKRLHKARRHTRSSSWPPNERTTKCSDLKLVEPVVVKKQYLLSRTNLPSFREENFRVPFQDGSESNDLCLKTGNLFSNQNSSCKSVSTLEAFVPCSHASRTCDEFHEVESKDGGKLKNSAVPHSQWFSKDSASAVGTLFKRPYLKPKFNKECGSFLEVDSPGVLGDAPCKGKFSASELANTMAHIRGSSPDAVISTLSPALMGASADADDRICTSPLIKDVYLSKPSKLSINRPAVVFGDTENKINKAQLRVALKEHPGKVCGKEMKTRRNFGFLYGVGQSKTLNQSRANPCECSGTCNGGCSDKVGVHNRGSGVSTASKSIQRKQNAGLGTFATNAGPFVTKEFYDLQSFNTDLKRCDPVVADHPLNPNQDLTTKMSLARVSSGDFKRPSYRETILDEYWVQRFEDSGSVNFLDTSYPKATPPQKRITDECHRFNFSSTANMWKPDEKEKLKSFPYPSAHIPLNTNNQSYNSCDVPQQTQVSFIQTKQRHTQGASAYRSPLEGTSMLRTLQEESLQGGMRRLASRTDKKELFCDDGRTTEPSRLNKAWIQRWRSSSNLIAMSGKTFSPSLGIDKELGSVPAKCPVITSYKGEKDMDCFDRNLLEPGRRTGKFHMDGSARHYDSGLGATPRGSFPVYRSHDSLRGKYMAPNVEAMAIVGNMAAKLRTTSLQNRGSFSCWPCPSEENFQERRLPEPRETVDDNMHGVDMDDLEFLEHQMR